MEVKQTLCRVSIQDFFLGGGGGGEGGNIDACKRCIRVLVHPLDFNEILDIFKDKKCPLKSIIMLPIVAVLRQL